MRKIGMFILGSVLAVPATAADLPRFDVEAHCKQVASFGGAASSTLMNGCMDIEQKAYNALKDAWDEIPEQTRQHCQQVATFGGGGSYQLLEGCVDLEMKASSQPRKFQY